VKDLNPAYESTFDIFQFKMDILDFFPSEKPFSPLFNRLFEIVVLPLHA
jgi:hypothetical protein